MTKTFEKVKSILRKVTGVVEDKPFRKRTTVMRNNFELPGDAVGIAVFDGERLLGLDLFDRRDTMRHFGDGILKSMLMQCIDVLAREMAEDADTASECGSPVAADEAAAADAAGADAGQRTDALLASLAASRWDALDAPGSGETMELVHGELHASALVADGGAVVHLQAFATDASHHSA